MFGLQSLSVYILESKHLSKSNVITNDHIRGVTCLDENREDRSHWPVQSEAWTAPKKLSNEPELILNLII